jgi:hypothetical protein
MKMRPRFGVWLLVRRLSSSMKARSCEAAASRTYTQPRTRSLAVHTRPIVRTSAKSPSPGWRQWWWALTSGCLCATASSRWWKAQ